MLSNITFYKKPFFRLQEVSHVPLKLPDDSSEANCLRLLPVGVFPGNFFTYYKPDIEFPDFRDYLKRGNHSCECPVEAQIQGSNPNSSSEQHVEAPTDGPKQIQDVERNTPLPPLAWNGLACLSTDPAGTRRIFKAQNGKARILPSDLSQF
ncbi:unnamed protein product [Pleuronectes platessa]|uniref:Uncharacterized protein n=1 Tax=Pleuronectes platessa TaxID=8262 RepID=A0A9N7VZ41_PLEPL|nr:unnamed protein product [Pleuronectes platessa]